MTIPPTPWGEAVALHLHGLLAPRDLTPDGVELVSVDLVGPRLRVVVRVPGAGDPVGLTRDLRDDWGAGMTDPVAVAEHHYWDCQSPVDTSNRPLVLGARWWGSLARDREVAGGA